MNTLGRRRRGSQGDLVFQDLRSSVKQNKLSSVKVNDVGKWDASGVWAKKPGLGRVASQAGFVVVVGSMLSQQGVGAGSVSCVFGLTCWSLGRGGNLSWEDWHSERLPVCGAAARARRFLIFSINYRISRFVFIFPCDANPSFYLMAAWILW